MIGEEVMILGGDTSMALGTTPTPTLVGVDDRRRAPRPQHLLGDLRRAHARRRRQRLGRGRRPGRDHPHQRRRLVGHVRRRRRRKSANATVSIASGTTGSIAAAVAPVPGACGYAWFWGAAGSEVLGAITTINSVVITATATGTQTAASLGSSDNSTNALVFDGLIYPGLQVRLERLRRQSRRPAPPAPARR